MATNSRSIDELYDEDTAKHNWAEKEQQQASNREAKSIRDTKTAQRLTQSELAKRPDLWYAMPVNHY